MNFFSPLSALSKLPLDGRGKLVTVVLRYYHITTVNVYIHLLQYSQE